MQISDYLEVVEMNYKVYKETLGGGGHVYHVYCGHGFMGIVKTHQVVYVFIHV